MAPLRIGFLGLSPDSWALRAHLPFLLACPDKYQVVALCNSSKESAQAAVEKLKLPNAGSIRTYGSPVDLAADPDLDLVVCSIRVDRHYDALKPIVAAGRDCFCEWPLGRDVREAEELARLASEKKIKTVTGFQTRFFPGVGQLRNMLQEGSIGTVLSSSLWSSAGIMRNKMRESAGYLNVLETGAFNVPFGHLMELVMFVLGSWGTAQQSAFFTTGHKEIQLEDAKGQITGTVERTVPDESMLQARLPSGALVSIHQRGQGPFKGEPGLLWRIYGTEGELEVTAPISFPAQYGGELTIRRHELKSDTVETIKIDQHGGDGIFELDIAHPAKSVGRVYEAFRQGRTGDYPDWERAVQAHGLIDSALQGYQAMSKA